LRFDIERAPLALGVVFFVVALLGLGAADITGDDEAREVGIVQDVVAGHWLWPRFNGDLIPDKPILTHWLGAVPVALAGFSETAVRLPSALAAAGVVAWTTRFGMQLLGAGPGIAAGLLLATFPAFAARARLARPDMIMLLFLAAALGYAFRAHREGRARDATWSLVLLGLATFAKGPVAPALYAATLLPFLFWQGDLRRIGRFVTLPGLAALVVLGGGWYAIALAGWGEEFVREHLVGRYLRNLAGGMVSGAAYSPKSLLYHATFYPLHLPAIALPWTPLIAVALVRLHRRGAFRSPLVRFLVCWAIAPILVFTPAEWKLRYYLLPSLPALALLAGPLAEELVMAPSGRPRATRASLWAGAFVVVGGGAAAFLVLARPDLLARADQVTVATLLSVLPGRTSAALLVGSLLGITGAAVALRLWGPLIAVTGALAAGWFAVGAPAVAAAAPDATSLRRFATVARERYPAPSGLAFFGLPVRSVVVYVGHPVPTLARDPGRVTPGLGVIATARAYERLSADGVVGERLAIGEGQIGNLERGTLILAEGRTKSP
jgi:4-amino-4-deoxy-L-arabinose transferase-like glycosyltransferase